ncbi:MAG: energy transducer TonB [Candidatus Competibacteraceae bacterium]|jgi:protein TonB|nr:energy transducer TonB [Candidatus Competibacteraceae bacterium]
MTLVVILRNEEQRLGLALTLAIAFHLLILLGVSFTILPEKTQQAALSLQITLQEEVGGEPDLSTGTEPNQPTAVEPQPPQPSPQPPAEQPSATPAATVTPTPPPPSEPKVATATPTKPQPTQPAPPRQPQAPRTLTGTDLRKLGLQMARLKSPPQQNTSNSREKHLNPRSMTTLEKFYEESWVRKVEQVGNLNFPEEARRRNLTAGPILEVAVLADGSVDSIRILRSSGHVSLDEAAKQIVSLAAPYPAFPPELRRQYDILYIKRQWKFEQGKLSGR